MAGDLLKGARRHLSEWIRAHEGAIVTTFAPMSSPDEDEVLLDAARAVRPYLSELVGQPTAAELDAELAALLASARGGHAVADRVAEMLSRSAEVQAWAAGFLEHGCPPEVAELRERAFQGLPGVPEAPSPDKFRCPEGDYVFYRRAVGVRVPPCPTHKTPLER